MVSLGLNELNAISFVKDTSMPWLSHTFSLVSPTLRQEQLSLRHIFLKKEGGEFAYDIFFTTHYNFGNIW